MPGGGRSGQIIRNALARAAIWINTVRLNCDAAGNILGVKNKRFRPFATSSFPTKLLKDALNIGGVDA